jgi:hypothetical protein
MNIRSLLTRTRALAAKIAPALQPPCIVLHAVEDDSLTPQDAERIRIASAAGVPVVRIHFGHKPAVQA